VTLSSSNAIRLGNNTAIVEITDDDGEKTHAISLSSQTHFSHLQEVGVGQREKREGLADVTSIHSLVIIFHSSQL